VEPGLVKAVAWMESGWRQDLASATGAVGLMQIEPYTGEWVSQFLAHRALNLRTAEDNVTAGTLLIGHLIWMHGATPPRHSPPTTRATPALPSTACSSTPSSTSARSST